MKIYVKEPGKKGYVKEIEDTLQAKQDIVGGLIEFIHLGDHLAKIGIDLVGNDEAKLLGLPPNVFIVDINREDDPLIDLLTGTLYFCGFDGEGGSISLTQEQINYIEEILFSMNGMYFLPFDNEI